MVQVFCPTWFLGLCKGTEHPQKCPVEALNLNVPLGVIWGSMRMLHAAQLDLPMEAIFKFSPLIIVNSERKTNPENKIIVKFLGNCFSWHVSRSIGLGIACEMVHHNEDIFAPSSALLQMKEVNGDRFKRRGSHNGWSRSLKRGGLLFNPLTDMLIWCSISRCMWGQ